MSKWTVLTVLKEHKILERKATYYVLAEKYKNNSCLRVGAFLFFSGHRSDALGSWVFGSVEESLPPFLRSPKISGDCPNSMKGFH
jgi:hypothetical protein